MKAFVLMPFNPELKQDYYSIFKPALEYAGYEVSRADDLFIPRPIILDIQKSIIEANLILCEMTGRNPNVFYELGLAHALGKPAVLVSLREEDIPFDLRHIRAIIYDKAEHNWQEKLRNSIIATANAVKNTRESWPPPLYVKNQKNKPTFPVGDAVPGVTGDIVFNMKCRAKSSSTRSYDNPPRSTTLPYPYAFALNQPAKCTIVTDVAIWAPHSGLFNVVEVIIDGQEVGFTRQNDSMNHQFLARTARMGIGRHEIEYRTHFEDKNRKPVDDINKSEGYWMLWSVRVFADMS